MEGMLAPEVKEEVIGQVEVRDTIKARIDAWCSEMCEFGVC